jgi:hypothetical protein
MCWDSDEKCFKLKEKKLSLTPEDIALVMGLGTGGSQVAEESGCTF